MKTKAIVYYLCIVMAAVSLPAPAQPGGTGRGGPGRPLDGRGGRFQHPGALCQDLTEEQRQQLRELVKGLREQGAGREEIHAAVEELFAEWGLEMPERGHGRGFGGALCQDLTEEQRQQLRELVKGLREQGAGREEIHAAVEELFAEWGLEMPERGHGRGFGDGLCQDLTEEQRQQLRELVKGLREQGAGREEIHAAVEELFAEWGLEMPDGNRFAKRRFHHYIMKNLTREQRRQVRKVVRELRQNGATRKEIYDAVIELLQEWGIEPPEKPGDHGAANKKYPVDKTVDAMNYPNPFNPTTTINYQVAEPGHVTVEIYNIQGQFIRTLRDRFHEPGEFTAHWDGRDEEGRAVASGTFLYRINTPAGSVTKQMTLMK